jgi:hypothetical protein
MAKTEDVAQFLKGTPYADEVGFLSRLSQPLRQDSKIKNPDRASPSAQIIERIQRRTNLLTDFGFRIDVLKSVNQRGIFGTQFFSQFVHSLKQRIEFISISHLVGLLHLVTELGHLAIDSSLDLVAADDFEDLLRVRLGHPRWRRILSLRPYWRGGDHQDGNNQPQVHEYLLGYAAAMMTANPKKVTK